MTAHPANWQERVLEIWRRLPTEFAGGLAEQELQKIEHIYGFAFPPDLRLCLSDQLPIGLFFPNWSLAEYRTQEPGGPVRMTRIHELLRHPLEATILQVEKSDFWADVLGPRPDDSAARTATVRAAFDRAPRLIPIYSHRFIPATPLLPGNPIFSFTKFGVGYYGAHLSDYLEIEFFGGDYDTIDPNEIRRIDFWSDLEEAD